jgi:hypothetical protein
VVKTSKAYLPAWIAQEDAASIHASVGIPSLAGFATGKGDLFRCILAGDGVVYCFRGEDETKTVLAAGLRFRDCERIDGVGLGDRPLLAFNGNGLGWIRSSHASSSDVVESYRILPVRRSNLTFGESSCGLALPF